MSLFQVAQRTQAKLRLAIDGPSGSGKTYSALLIAKGLTGGDLSKVALIDTERGSGSLYADLGPYAVAQMHPPYSPEKFMAAIDAAADEGFEVIVIDSLSHAWAGEGGVLDYVDKVAASQTRGNSFAAWKHGSKVQNKLVDHILASPCHVIATMRTKTEWVIEEDERGKKVPRKIGMAVRQRDDVEYEFTTYLNLARDGHIATAGKDRTGLFDQRLEAPSEAMGAELLEWLGTAVQAPPPAPIEAPAEAPVPQDDAQANSTAGNGNGNGTISQTDAEKLRAIIAAKGRDEARMMAWLASLEPPIGDGENLASIPKANLAGIIEMLAGLPDPQPPQAAPTPAAGANADPGAPSATEATQEVAAPAAASDASDASKAYTEVPVATSAPDDGYPFGCTLDRSFESCAAINDGREPECAGCKRFDESFVELDQATRGNRPGPDPEAEPAKKKGTITEPQLQRLGKQCAELESLGVGTSEWRSYLKAKFGVTSRTELTKTGSAPKAIDALGNWITDIKAGIATPGQEVA